MKPAAGIEPGGKWYSESGQGMGAVLTIADEKDGYALADRGTFIAYGDKVRLTIAYEGGKELSNPYGIIAVNPARHPHVKSEEARALVEWLVSDEGRAAIAAFRLGGLQLFHPVPPE